MPKSIGVLSVLAFAVALPAQAEESVAQTERPVDASEPDGLFAPYDVTVGAAVMIIPDYAGSDDYTFFGAPTGRIERDGYKLMIDGPGIAADLLPSDTFALGPRIGYAGGRSNVEDSVVDRMADVDAGMDIGLTGGITVPLFFPNERTPSGIGPVFGTVNASVAQEVAGGHGGLTADVGVGVVANVYSLNIGFNSGLNFATDDYVDGFFGVDASDSLRSGLAQYDPDGGLVSLTNSVRVSAPVIDRVSVTAIGSWTRYVGDAADSPVVSQRGSENTFTGILGLSYQF